MKQDKRWKEILANLDVYSSTAILILLIVITFLGVVFRYVIGRPFTWLEEVQLMCMVWIGFLTAGAAFRSGSHIAIEMVVDMLPSGVQKIVQWIIRAVVLLVLFYLFKQCVGYFMLFVGNRRMTPVLRIPYWLVYFVAPVSCALMIVGFLSSEVKIRQREKGGSAD